MNIIISVLIYESVISAIGSFYIGKEVYEVHILLGIKPGNEFAPEIFSVGVDGVEAV
jgi:hypothetical protein